MKWTETMRPPSVNEKGQWPILQVARAIILSPDRQYFLLAYRAGSHFRGQGENPGGKVEGEDLCQELCRELQEELSLEPDSYTLSEDLPFLDFMQFDPKHSHTPNTPYAKKLILTYTYVLTLKPNAQIQLSLEHSHLSWNRVSSLETISNIAPYTRSALQAWERNNGRVTFSALAGKEGKMLNQVTYPNLSHASPNQGANR